MSNTPEGPVSASPSVEHKDQPGSDTSPPAPDPEVCLDCLPRSPVDDRPFEGCGCDACDSESVEIRCQAAGLKARAQYVADHAQGPSPERYETTRLAYGRARYAVAPVVTAQRARLLDVLHEIRCMIDDDSTIDCLDRAWHKVGTRLRECTPEGCCVERYDFEPQTSDCHLDHLVAQIARYRQVAEQADECFARLAAEPDALRARVTAVVAEIDAVAGILHPAQAPATPAAPTAPATAGEPGAGAAAPAAPTVPPVASPPDLVTLYATALDVRWHLDSVWWAYPDIDDFVECLCRAMRVSMEGHDALAVLTGELAVRMARWQERNECCRRLREHAVDEVIERYVRCLEHPDDEPDDDDERDRDHHRDRDRDRGDRDRGDRDGDRGGDRGDRGDRDRDRDRDRGDRDRGDRDRNRGDRDRD